MTTYKTVRGKTVSLGAVQLVAGLDGTLDLVVGDQHIHLTEAEASVTYELMGDVVSWESSTTGVSENALDREAENAAHHNGGGA